MIIPPAFFINKPLIFKDLCYIYPPKVKDIITNSKFNIYTQILTTSQEDIWDMFKDKANTEGDVNLPDPFELLLLSCSSDENYQKYVEEAFLFFTQQEVRILLDEKLILFTKNIGEVKDIVDLKTLNEEDFFDFQNFIRAAIGVKMLEQPDPDEDPRVTRIKAKARERDRIKQQKGIGGISLSTTLASLCCMGLGINPLNIGEISYASLVLLLSTYQEQERYRVDMQLIAGGADPKKIKPKYWIRNLDN